MICTSAPSISGVMFLLGSPCRRLRRTIIQAARNMRLTPATPPTTPPAIAPVLTLCDPDVPAAAVVVDDISVDVLEATELALELVLEISDEKER